MKLRKIWNGMLAMTMTFSLLPWNAVVTNAEGNEGTVEQTAEPENTPEAATETAPAETAEATSTPEASPAATIEAVSTPEAAPAATVEATSTPEAAPAEEVSDTQESEEAASEKPAEIMSMPMMAAPRKAPVNKVETYDGTPEPSIDKTDLYISVKEKDGDPVKDAEVTIYKVNLQAGEYVRDDSSAVSADTGSEGYALFKALDDKSSYVAELTSVPGTEGYVLESSLSTKPFKIAKTSFLRPVNVASFVLDKDEKADQGYTITTWLKDTTDSDKPAYVAGSDVAFTLTSEDGKTVITKHPNDHGIVVFDGLKPGSNYSVKLTQVPVKYAYDSKIDEINNQNDHTNIPVILNQTFNYSAFELQSTPHEYTFEVVENGDNNIKISGAVFTLTKNSKYVSDADKTIYLMSDENGTLHKAHKVGRDITTGQDTFEILKDEENAGNKIWLTAGEYTMHQISSDDAHKPDQDSTFTVYERGDSFTIHNDCNDYSNQKISFGVTKLWGDEPGSAEKKQIKAVIDIQRAVIGEENYEYSTYTQWKVSYSKSGSYKRFDLPKYTNDGHRYIYKVQEEELNGWYADYREDSDGNYTITNYKGSKEGTDSDAQYWVSSSTKAYLVQKNKDGDLKVVESLDLNVKGTQYEPYGHEIAYIKDGSHDYLYGVSNRGEMIRIDQPGDIAKNGGTLKAENAHRISLTGIPYSGKNGPLTHTMEFTRDGRYLMLAAQHSNIIYMIPREYVDEQINNDKNYVNLQDSNVKKITFDGVNSSDGFDGDIIEVADGTLLFTAERGNIYRLKYDVNELENNNEVNGSALRVGHISESFESGQTPQHNTVEGLLNIDGTIYATGTVGTPHVDDKKLHDNKAYLYPLAHNDDYSDVHLDNVNRPSDGVLIGQESNNQNDPMHDFVSLTGATNGPGETPKYNVPGEVKKVWIGDTESDHKDLEVTAVLYWRYTDPENPDKPKEEAYTYLDGGEEKNVEVVLNESNGWKGKTDVSLPKFDDAGKEITYFWREKESTIPDGYVSGVSDDGRTITNTKVSGFSFVKQDSKGNPLSGAQFQLRLTKNADGSDASKKDQGIYTRTAVSDDNGLVTFNDLKPGTYELIELRAPKGYKRLTGKFNVTISVDGTQIDPNPNTGDEPADSNVTYKVSRLTDTRTLKKGDIVEFVYKGKAASLSGNDVTTADALTTAGTYSEEKFTPLKSQFWKVESLEDISVRRCYALELSNCSDPSKYLYSNGGMNFGVGSSSNGIRYYYGTGNRKAVINFGTASNPLQDVQVYKAEMIKDESADENVRNAKSENKAADEEAVSSENPKVTFRYVGEGKPYEIIDGNLVVKNTIRPKNENDIELPHKKTIDAFRIGNDNPDTTLDNTAEDTTDLYRLYLDLGPYKNDKGTDLALVLDNSGSMIKFSAEGGKRRYQVMNDALNKFIPEFLSQNPDNRVSIVYFAGRTENQRHEENQGERRLDLASWSVTDDYGNVWLNKDQWDATLTDTDHDGKGDTSDLLRTDCRNDPKRNTSSTDYTAGLKTVQEILDQSEGRYKAMMFLSDGIPTEFITSEDTLDGDGDTRETKVKDSPGYYDGIDNENKCKEPTLKAIDQFREDNPDLPIAAVAFSDSVKDLNDSYALQALATDDKLFTITDSSAGIIAALNNLTVSNVTITDELSQYVEVYQDQPDYKITMSDGTTTTVLYEKDEKSGGYHKTEAGKEVIDSVIYRDATDPEHSTGTVKVKFKPEYGLKEGYTYTISFNVKTTYAAYDEYLKNGYGGVKGDPDTDYESEEGYKTSSEREGLHSNNHAWYTASTHGTDITEDYDHPVIQVYTQDIRIIKTDKTGSQTLDGAEFDLYRAARDTDKQTVKIPTTNIDGIKINTTPLTTANGGLINLKDLIYGENYYLVETKAPEGFKKLSAPIKFHIHRYIDQKRVINVEIKVDSESSEYAFNEETEQKKHSDRGPELPATGPYVPKLFVANERAYELPKAGGIGTYLYTIFGTAIVSLMGMFVINEMKKKREA